MTMGSIDSRALTCPSCRAALELDDPWRELSVCSPGERARLYLQAIQQGSVEHDASYVRNLRTRSLSSLHQSIKPDRVHEGPLIVVLKPEDSGLQNGDEITEILATLREFQWLSLKLKGLEAAFKVAIEGLPVATVLDVLGIKAKTVARVRRLLRQQWRQALDKFL